MRRFKRVNLRLFERSKFILLNYKVEKIFDLILIQITQTKTNMH